MAAGRIGTAYVDVRGDFSGLNKQMKGKVGAAMKIGGAAMAAGIGVALKQSIDEARESIKVGKQTAAVLKSTGGAAKISAKQIGELANAISAKVGVDDEAIQSSENLLLTFRNVRNETGKGNDIFDQSTKAIVDMTAALNNGKVTTEGLKGSTVMVGKALNDPIKGMAMLGRAGVQFTQGQKDQIKALVESGDRMKAQKIILRELNSEFKGSAAAQADPFDKFNVAVKNLEETVGLALLPTLGKAADVVATFISELQSGAGAGGNFGRAVSRSFTEAKDSATRFWNSLDLGKRDMENVKTAFHTVGVAMYAVSRKYLPAIKQQFSGTFRVIGGIVKVFASLLSGDFRGMWSGIKQIFSGAFTQLKGTFKAATAPLRAAASAMWHAISGTVSSAWGGIVSKVQGFVNKIIDVINFLPLGKDLGHVGVSVKTTFDKEGNANTRVKPKAAGGFLGGVGRHDTVPIMAAPGEAIVNRHQQAPINAALMAVYGTDLEGIFSKIQRPHYMAGGGIIGKVKSAIGGLGLPSPGTLGLPGEAGKIMSGITHWLSKRAGDAISKLMPSGGATSTHGLVPQVRRALAFAKRHGWPGGVSSGFRSHDQQASLYARYLAGGTLAAPPGSSSHEKGQAVDVSAAESFAKAMGIAPGNARLMRLVPGEPWHFSVTGHARGGFVGATKGFVRAARGLSAAAIKKYWLGAGGSKSRAQIMTAIALAESGGNTRAINHNSDGSIDKGLWQINSVHGFKGNLFSAPYNANAAASVWRKQGLGAWATYNNGAYKSFMAAAKDAVPKAKAKVRPKKTPKRKAQAIAAPQSLSGEVSSKMSDWMSYLDNRVTTGSMTEGRHDEFINAALARPDLNLATRAALTGSLSSGGGSGASESDTSAADAAAAAAAQLEQLKEIAAQLKSNREFAEKTHAAIGGEVQAAATDGLFKLLGVRSSAGFSTATPKALYG